MAQSTRTLQRRLAAQGTSLRALVVKERIEAGCRLLNETDLTVAEVSAALGYAHAPAFVRAFLKATRTTPAAWRAVHRKGRTPGSSG